MRTIKAVRKRTLLLEDYGIPGGFDASALEDVVEQAAHRCGTAMASISLLNDRKEHFLASHGFKPPRRRRNLLFCEHVARTREALLVTDAAHHEFFRGSPLVSGAPQVAFYFGVPLVSPEGVVIGALAVMDRASRTIEPAQRDFLFTLAGQVIAELERQRKQCSLLFDNDGLKGVADEGVSQFLEIFNGLPSPIVVLDPSSFHIVTANDAYLRVTQRKRSELIGLHLFEAFPADPSKPEAQQNVENVRRSLERVRDTGQIDLLPLQHYAIPRPASRGGGFEDRYWSAASSPIFGAEGRLKYIVHRADDVTSLVERLPSSNKVEQSADVGMVRNDLVQRTEQLQRANEHLRLAQRVANIGSWELKVPSLERSWSDEIYAILGIAPGAQPFSDEKMMEYVHPDDRERLREAREAYIAGDESIPQIEHRIIRADGSVRHVIQRARVIRDSNGVITSLYGTMQDVTEQRRAEQEMRIRARQQAAVSQLGQMALRETDLRTVSQEAMRLVADVLEVEYSKVLKLLPEEQKVQLIAGVGWREGLVGKAKVGIGRDSQAGYTLQADGPVIVKDLRTDKRFQGPPLLREHGVISGLSVVIEGEHGPWGVLGTHTTRHRDFTHDDVHFVQSIANIIAEANRRAETELALRSSERRFRLIVDSALDAVIAIDEESRFTEWNPQAEATFGWKAEEVIGKHMPELIIPEPYRAAHYDGLKNFLRTGDGPLLNRRVEVPALHKRGHEFPVELSIAPVELDGRITFSAFIRDITERKRAEIAIRENEERFRMVSKATADTIWDWNLLDDSVWWNEGMQTVFGYSPKSIEPDSRSFLLRIHPDDKNEVTELVRNALEGENDEWSHDYRFRRANGSYAFVSVRGYVVRDEFGKPVRMVGGMNDITEGREQEEQIAEQAALLDKAHDAIIVRDMNDRITYWNQSAERVYGFSETEALGRNVHELLQEPADVIEPARKRVLETGDWIGEVRQRRKDGEEVVSEVAWSLITNKANRPTGIMAINTDITERLALEEQLRQSQRLESVGQLTGGVAHDFNNLLTVILGNAELLSDQIPADNRLHKLAEMTRTAALRGAELTHRLLAFARRQALEPQVVDVNDLVEGMNGLLRRTLLENIDLEFVQSDDVWRAFVDPGQLESVILNLCINAKDAMPNGGQLTIETSNAELDDDYASHNTDVAPGRYVMIAVSDTGIGIRPENVSKVFDPFFTTKEKGKGTGLGLSMAYGFAKQSHGHIKIYSEPGQGTTVRIYLPRATRAADHAEPVKTDDRDLTGSETVLIVEDNDLVRQHAESQLHEYGYEVLSARNGPEALEILRRKDNIDLLFTDVIMSGGLNGRELAETAKRIRPRLKVLYTSGYTENAIVHHGKLDRGVHLLQKPYQRRDLARKVRGVLNEASKNEHPGNPA